MCKSDSGKEKPPPGGEYVMTCGERETVTDDLAMHIREQQYAQV